MGKFKYSYGQCENGWKCYFILRDSKMCGKVTPSMDSMQRHCRTHVDPTYAEKKKEYDRERNKKPERKAAGVVRSRKSKAKMRSDPVKHEEVKKRERERRAVYAKDPVFVAKQAVQKKESQKKHIQRNMQNGIKMKCKFCPFKSWSAYTLNTHVKRSHKFDSKSAKTYKAMVGKRFTALCETREKAVVPFPCSQEITSTDDFLGIELAADAWDILKDDLIHKKYSTYCFLCVDQEAGTMGLVPYLKKVRKMESVTLDWYFGKHYQSGPSEYHSNKNIGSTVRDYCERENKVAFLIYSEEHDIGDRFENKKASETEELFWQIVGELQLCKINEGRCQWKIMNTKTEIATGKERQVLTQDFVKEAAHVSLACDGLICLDYVAGECNKLHNANGLCSRYGSKHLDLSQIQPYEFKKKPATRQPKILRRNGNFVQFVPQPSTSTFIQE